MRPKGPRDPIAGPDSGPEYPFPLTLGGEVIKGFGRGSKEVRTLIFSPYGANVLIKYSKLILFYIVFLSVFFKYFC